MTLKKGSASRRVFRAFHPYHASNDASVDQRVGTSQLLRGHSLRRNVLDARSRAAARRSHKHTHLDIPDELEDPADPSTEWIDDDDDNNMNLADVLDGTVAIELSHAGGELEELLEDDEAVNGPLSAKAKQRRAEAARTRRDRTERRNNGFNAQMESMVDAYMKWEHEVGGMNWSGSFPTPDEASVQGEKRITAVDVFGSSSYAANLIAGDRGVAAALLRQGLLPCSPFDPSVAFTIRTVEIYRRLHLRCPHLALQPFVKGLCDLHGVPWERYLSDQFSICYDLYLRLRDEAQKRVLVALDRDKNKWRLRNACPACTYRLEGESKLIFEMLVTMDGNDSLKRILRRGSPDEQPDGQLLLGSNVEMLDNRTVSGDYYLSRERVDRWAKEIVKESLPEATPSSSNDTASPSNDTDIEDTPCAGRWQNMVNEVTARMWGIFDETGIFLALCRHGFALVVLDMVKSGELSKYPLAVVEELLDAFGSGIGGGYDIGCRFGITLDRSELGPRARELNYQALVGAFHGHAHNRLCQLSKLATYVQGMGLEDLEGCERFFSKSNGLAPSQRYSSRFHRQQQIVEFIKHVDSLETSHALSHFIVNNYKQALSTLQGEGALKESMAEQGITSTRIFHDWLAEEREYLKGLQKEPIQETLEMDYYQKLVNLRSSEEKLQTLQTTWKVYTPTTGTETSLDPTTSTVQPPKKRNYNAETKMRHAMQTVDKDLKQVQLLEEKLEITKRWEPGSEDWMAAAHLVSKCRYQRCLDELEGLIVSRIFELTKMNLSQTGYKLRKHIAKSLQSRSQAIKTALERYNAAADAMSPRRSRLTWQEVVEYAFLADFDLLRDTREDIRNRAWARPRSRIMLDQYFKMERAHEEIQRLNIEIRRVITHMQDEAAYLKQREHETRKVDAVLAHHIGIYRLERTRFFHIHTHRFKKLAEEPGFSGSLQPGVPLNKAMAIQNLKAGEQPVTDVVAGDAVQKGGGEEFDEEESMDQAYNILLALED